MVLGALLDPGFRQAASVLVLLGQTRKDLGDLAPLVASIEVSTGRNEAATGTVVIEDRRGSDGRWLAADHTDFARWAPIMIVADFVTHQEEVFRGYISKMTPNYPAMAGEASLTLEIQDDSLALSREHMRRVWGADVPINDLAILTELVATAGLAPHPECGHGASSRSLAQDSPPIQFLRERATANGYELIFDQGQVYFGPMRLAGESQAPLLVYAGRSTNCRSVSIDDDAQHPDAIRIDMAPKDQGAVPQIEEVTTDQAPLGSTAVAAEGSALGIAASARLTREGDETPEEARSRAQGIVNEHAFRIRAAAEIDGTAYGHVLKVGRLVTVDGAGARYDGRWYVDQVAHHFSPDGYRQQVQLMRNATGSAGAVGAAPLSAGTSAIAGLFAGASVTAGFG